MRRGTYSIVARDPSTGEVGAAVQSHWFAVGPIVPWVRAGVGAVCTQSVAEPAHGPAVLDRLEDGMEAPAALAAVLAADDAAAARQVGVVDAAALPPSTRASAASRSRGTRAGRASRRRPT
jgi:uncharacterized Ntn-hydrolase superfamily protein